MKYKYMATSCLRNHTLASTISARRRALPTSLPRCIVGSASSGSQMKTAWRCTACRRAATLPASQPPTLLPASFLQWVLIPVSGHTPRPGHGALAMAGFPACFRVFLHAWQLQREPDQAQQRGWSSFGASAVTSPSCAITTPS